MRCSQSPLVCLILLFVFVPFMYADDYGEWEKQQYGMATYLSGVCFADHDFGWAVGAIDGIGPSIHVTANGGETWSIQSTTMYNLMYLGCDCSDDQNMWICGVQFLYPGMVMTHDGGQTWETASMPGFIWSAQNVEAVDAQHIKIPSFWTNLIGGEKLGITLSDNGGASWAGHEWGIATYPRYCCFLDENRGWMTGGTWPEKRGSGFRLSENSPPLQDVPPQVAGLRKGTQYEAAIAKTTDGGRTWTPLFWDTGNFYLNQICMIDDNEGWAVGEAGYTAYILHTTDGWTTFEQQTPPGSNYGLMTVDFMDSQEGFAVGFGPGGFDVTMVCLHTMDGGQTWTLDKPGINTGPIDAEFLDSTEGWAVGGNNMQQSTVAHYTNNGGGGLTIALSNTPSTASPGDIINWRVDVANQGTSPVTFDYWLEVSGGGLPSTVYRLIASNITFSAGQAGGGTMSLYLPHSTPPGTYTFDNCVGDYHSNVVDSESFDLDVL